MRPFSRFLNHRVPFDTVESIRPIIFITYCIWISTGSNAWQGSLSSILIKKSNDFGAGGVSVFSAYSKVKKLLPTGSPEGRFVLFNCNSLAVIVLS